MPVIQGEAYWASITTPNTKFTPMYQVNLAVDDQVAKEFKSRGFHTKEIEGKPTISFKRKVARKDGGVNEAPRLVDKFKNPIDQAVGNGSTVNVQYREWETTNKYGTFKGLDLQAVQVVELVESEAQPDGAEFAKVESEGEIF